MDHVTNCFIDLAFPPVIFGSTSLGNFYESVPEHVHQSIVSEWFQRTNGTVVIDSAGKYGAGLALENIARCLSTLNVAPDDVIISNKLGWRRVPLKGNEQGFEPGVWVDLKYDAELDISYDGILRCHEQGCELLGDYRPQLLSVHDPDEYLAAATDEADLKSRWDDIAGAYQALTELKQKGEVLGLGVGAKNWTTIREFTNRFELDWVMIANSFTLHSHPGELVDYLTSLHERNIKVINSALFNGGFLVGSEFYNYQPIDPASAKGADLIEWRENFRELCKLHDVLPAHACIEFGASHPAIDSIALSSSKVNRVVSNVEFASKKLPREFWDAMRTEGVVAADYKFI